MPHARNARVVTLHAVGGLSPPFPDVPQPLTPAYGARSGRRDGPRFPEPKTGGPDVEREDTRFSVVIAGPRGRWTSLPRTIRNATSERPPLKHWNGRSRLAPRARLRVCLIEAGVGELHRRLRKLVNGRCPNSFLDERIFLVRLIFEK